MYYIVKTCAENIIKKQWNKKKQTNEPMRKIIYNNHKSLLS